MQTFELRRQKRKTLSIAVKQGKVIVSAPISLSTSDIERFLEEKTDWIKEKLADYRRKAEMFSDVAEYKVLLIEGRRYDIVFSDKAKRVKAEGNRILVPDKYDDKVSAVKAIGSFYKKLSAEKLKNRLDEISLKIGLPYATFSLTGAKSKWGSCDGKNNIMLNWRLYMLTPELIDYVIVHELCHTSEHNHSARFWSNVAKYCRNCKELRKELKTYSIINELFR